MTWVRRGLVQVWDGADFPEPDDAELTAFRYAAQPIEDRPRPSCGRPGSGRAAHARNGEPTCGVCARAEAAYSKDRRLSAVFA